MLQWGTGFPRQAPELHWDNSHVNRADPAFFQIRLASSEQDLLAAQRLRYRVFVEELGGTGPLVDHDARLERDEFDPVVDHLCLIDTRRDAASLDHVVGVYRLLPGERAAKFGRFYCDSEYDLDPLRDSGRPLLELGRSCVDSECRGGAAMFLMWNALADYVLDHGIEILFGVASFHGTDIPMLAPSLAWLHHHHLAPEGLRPVARAEGFQDMDLIAPERLDRREAMVGMPALIKAYLRLGGTVGEGAFIDRAFNTTDVFLMMDTEVMSTKHRDFYESRRHSS
jgi:putative hemolysin